MKKPIINPQVIKRLKKFFAIVQDSDTATRNIAAGKYVIWKNIPCHASAAIVSGDTLAIGTNLTADDDGFVNALNDSLANATTWKFVDKVKGTGVINLPVAKEYYFLAIYGTASAEQSLAFPFHGVPNNNGTRTLTSGYYVSANSTGAGQIAYNSYNRTVSLTLMSINGTDFTSTSYLEAYYR